MKARLLPNWPFPPYTHLPGKTIHPEKPGGHLYGKSSPRAVPIRKDEYINNAEYLYGLDLYNFGYYWEAHVWWEAVWNACGRKGEEADLLKGLIKLAAAGIKARLKQQSSALGHVQRAKELFMALSPGVDGIHFSGIPLNDLIDYTQAIEELVTSTSSFGLKQDIFPTIPFKNC